MSHIRPFDSQCLDVLPGKPSTVGIEGQKEETVRMEGQKEETFETGTYCFIDDDKHDLYCMIQEKLSDEKYRIIDFEEMRERIVVKSSLVIINKQKNFENATQKHNKYKSRKQKPKINLPTVNKITRRTFNTEPVCDSQKKPQHSIKNDINTKNIENTSCISTICCDLRMLGCIIFILVVLMILFLCLGYMQCPDGTHSVDEDQNTNDNPNNCLNGCIDNETFECVEWLQITGYIITGFVCMGLSVLYCFILFYQSRNRMKSLKCYKSIWIKIVVVFVMFGILGGGASMVSLGALKCRDGMYMQDEDASKYNPNKCMECIDEEDASCHSVLLNPVLITFGSILTVFGCVGLLYLVYKYNKD